MARLYAVSTVPVKPTRRTARPAARFGQGILPTHPTFRSPVSIADMEWHAQQADAAEDRWIDELYAECVAQDRVDAGTN